VSTAQDDNPYENPDDNLDDSLNDNPVVVGGARILVFMRIVIGEYCQLTLTFWLPLSFGLSSGLSASLIAFTSCCHLGFI
jgi:hypothetical protein